MKLPSEILSHVNIDASRHKNPELLRWEYVNGKWQATDGDQTYVIMYSEKLGTVVGVTHQVKLGANTCQK